MRLTRPDDREVERADETELSPLERVDALDVADRVPVPKVDWPDLVVVRTPAVVVFKAPRELRVVVFFAAVLVPVRTTDLFPILETPSVRVRVSPSVAPLTPPRSCLESSASVLLPIVEPRGL